MYVLSVLPVSKHLKRFSSRLLSSGSASSSAPNSINYLRSLGHFLHPAVLLLLRGGRHQHGLLPVAHVEAEVGSEARLVVYDGDVLQGQLAVDAEVKGRVRSAVRVQKQVRKLK